jgi:phenylpyruvate tautomerase PptA (4-oxalocrotonate tautomerase family)
MSILGSLIGPVTGLLDQFIEDKDQKARLAHELSTMAERHSHDLAKGQIEVNLAQAKHSSIFVAGARPAIMWVACLGLFWSYFLGPILNWAVVVSGSEVPLPEISTEGLLALTTSLLGLGAMRSFEKSKGVNRDSIKKEK